MTKQEKRRCRHDIKLALLRGADSGIKKTPLMFECKLSFTQHDKYLKELLRQGLISEEGGIWTTTPRGRCLAEKMQLVYDFMRE